MNKERKSKDIHKTKTWRDLGFLSEPEFWTLILNFLTK